MEKILKRLVIVSLVFMAAVIPCFADVYPTAGWSINMDGSYLATDGTAGLGYGYGIQGYMGADINRWSQFFGEVAVSCSKSEYPLSRFSQLKPPTDLMFGAGWAFSPGAGWSVALSGGLDIMKLSTTPDVFAAGLYASVTPRWVIGPLPGGDPYYNLSASFPVQVSFAGDAVHLRLGFSLGFDVSIYQMRRGNSFTGGAL